MTDLLHKLVKEKFGELLLYCSNEYDQLTIEFSVENFDMIFTKLRDDPDLSFEQMMDVCGVDYSTYGETNWVVNDATSSGFSRGIIETPLKNNEIEIKRRFAAVYHLLSVSKNWRLRVRIFAQDDNFPVLPSVVYLWSSANWFEREAFDLYGIIFEGHPDLRRILTDYGFDGHPMRKDFPMEGHVEMRYDPEKNRVVYEPTTIKKRVLTPRVIRN